MESASVFVFITLQEADHIGKAESIKLKNFFGAFPASSATKACHIVKNIISLLPEDCLATINKRSEGRQDEPSKEFGSDIKFMPLKKKDLLCDDDLISDSEDEDVEQKISFPSIKEEPTHLREKEKGSVVADDNSGINGSWLRDQCEVYFADSSSGLSVLDLCSAVFDILASDRDNAALQNELFELLGFDRFEFIQTLLANRHRIVIATSESASDLTESKGEVLVGGELVFPVTFLHLLMLLEFGLKGCLTLCFQNYLTVCSSRKYPYSPHGRFFVLHPLPPPPPPQEIPVLLHTWL